MEYWDSMSKAPASRSFHHAYTGGLLNHIIEVCWIGERIIDACSLDVNKDHYFAAALLHDIGKAKLYRKNDEGKWEHVPQEKRLDHSLKPILEFTIKTGVCLPEEVQVAILGHMGGWSQTSVFPDDMLSTVLHCADMISSRLDESYRAEGDI